MNVRYLIVNMTAYQTNIYHLPEKVAKDSEHMELPKEGESDKIKWQEKCKPNISNKVS